MPLAKIDSGETVVSSGMAIRPIGCLGQGRGLQSIHCTLAADALQILQEMPARTRLKLSFGDEACFVAELSKIDL
jgi:hypothetical protein